MPRCAHGQEGQRGEKRRRQPKLGIEGVNWACVQGSSQRCERGAGSGGAGLRRATESSLLGHLVVAQTTSGGERAEEAGRVEGMAETSRGNEGEMEDELALWAAASAGTGKVSLAFALTAAQEVGWSRPDQNARASGLRCHAAPRAAGLCALPARLHGSAVPRVPASRSAPASPRGGPGCASPSSPCPVACPSLPFPPASASCHKSTTPRLPCVARRLAPRFGRRAA